MRVLKTSLLSSVQDMGRSGYAHIGLCQSGAMDEFSFHYANLLLGNAFGTNTLEIYLGGIELEILTDTNIVLTGADADVRLNGSLMPLWKSFYVKSGDKLSLGFAKKGNIIYLGVKGGFESKKLFDSFSYSQKEGLGSALKVGDKLEVFASVYKEKRKLKDEFLPKFDDELSLRLSPSYQFDEFSKEDVKTLLSSTYTVSPQSNRMGFRLSGTPLKDVKKGIISEGICFGAVQVPSDGEPIVLLKERQTIGGYPKVGTVLPLDCFSLAQAKVGTRVRFEMLGFQQASSLMREFYKDFIS